MVLLYLGVSERWMKKMRSLLSKRLGYEGKGHLKNQLKYSTTNTISGYVLITVRTPMRECMFCLHHLRKISLLVIA